MGCKCLGGKGGGERERAGNQAYILQSVHVVVVITEIIIGCLNRFKSVVLL